MPAFMHVSVKTLVKPQELCDPVDHEKSSSSAASV